jgi:phosphoribosylformylglycinamidine synthase
VHDVSGGGLGVALAEMAISGGVGVRVESLEGHRELFSELPSRIVVATRRPDELVGRARDAGVPAELVGVVGGSRFVVDGLVDLGMDELAAVWSGALRARLEPV